MLRTGAVSGGRCPRFSSQPTPRHTSSSFQLAAAAAPSTPLRRPPWSAAPAGGARRGSLQFASLNVPGRPAATKSLVVIPGQRAARSCPSTLPARFPVVSVLASESSVRQSTGATVCESQSMSDVAAHVSLKITQESAGLIQARVVVYTHRRHASWATAVPAETLPPPAALASTADIRQS